MGKFSLTNFSVFRSRKPPAGEGKSKEVSSGPGSLKTRRNSSPPVLIYDEYHLTPKEYLQHALKALAADALFSYVFYRSLPVFLVFLPAVLFYPFYIKKDLIPLRKRKLLLQFREGLSVLSGSLSAGYSLENAFAESLRELQLLFGSDALIVREFEQIAHLISMNVPAERAMDDFAARSGVEEIRNFARILRIAKRSGGELVSIMRHSCDTIGDKIQVKEEILTMTASRRFEQNIMNIAPLLVVVYIDFTNPGFFSVMYTTAVGRTVMTVCLAAYLFSIRLSMKILSIEL